jgi:hypothetical protein
MGAGNKRGIQVMHRYVLAACGVHALLVHMHSKSLGETLALKNLRKYQAEPRKGLE